MGKLYLSLWENSIFYYGKIFIFYYGKTLSFTMGKLYHLLWENFIFYQTWIPRITHRRFERLPTFLLNHSAWQWSGFKHRTLCYVVIESCTLSIGRMMVKHGGSLFQMVMIVNHVFIIATLAS